MLLSGGLVDLSRRHASTALSPTLMRIIGVVMLILSLFCCFAFTTLKQDLSKSYWRIVDLPSLDHMPLSLTKPRLAALTS